LQAFNRFRLTSLTTALTLGAILASGTLFAPRAGAASVSGQSGNNSDGIHDTNVVVSVNGGGSQAAFIVPKFNAPGNPFDWPDPMVGTSWIAPKVDPVQAVNQLTGANYFTGGGGLANPAVATFQTSFNLPPASAQPSLSGLVLADDSVAVLLNGHLLLQQQEPNSTTGFAPASNFQTPSPFSTTNASFFVAGANTLTFVVKNAGGPGGLDFSFTASFTSGDTDGDGVPDDEDNCLNSDKRPFVVVDPAAGATNVPNLLNVDSHGCSIQDLVNALAAAAKNHGDYVSGIQAMVKILEANSPPRMINHTQANTLGNGAAHSDVGK